MKILELFSGIGGMHMALKESHVEGSIIAAVEINTIANTVYAYNFPETMLLNRNIEKLSAKFINELNVDTLLMSPPCQPFTRNGSKKDNLDTRTCSFTHLLSILPELHVRRILIENVKGFETSNMHKTLIETLKNNNFVFQEFILSPTQFGVSNSRRRYYCVAKKKPLAFNFQPGELMETYPNRHDPDQLFTLSTIIETDIDFKPFLLPEDVLKKRFKIMDVCTPDSVRSCCFTKAYGRYIEGTGSVFTPKSESTVKEAFERFISQNNESLTELELRFFTPTEVARLMSFPSSFKFPQQLSNVQKYRLLGNSINVKVVSELIKLLE